MIIQTHASSYALRLLAALLVTGMTVGLGIVIFMLSLSTQGLETIVAAHMANSGVTHPVTAVLLNFRGYDTFLEMAALLMALIGAWSLAPVPETRLTKPGAVLDYLARLLTPLVVVAASYLLWAGSHSPGGAYFRQAPYWQRWACCCIYQAGACLLRQPTFIYADY